MYEIDVIIAKKERWIFKEVLTKRNLQYIEWFVEFDSKSCIISFEVDTKENLKEVFDFLKNNSPKSRLILPNGSNIQPSREDFEEIRTAILSKLNIKE